MVDFIVYIRVIRVIRSTNHPLFSFVIMSFCLQENHLSPFVIMSFCLQENHLSPFVIMSFCLQKNICLYFSLCHSVSKKSSISIFHYVILSSKNHLSPFVIMSFCLQENHLSPFVIMSFCLKKNICLHLSLCHSVFKKIICLHLSLCHSVFKKIICLHLSLCHSVSKISSVFVRPPVILSLIYSVCLMLKCLYKEAYKGPEKRRGICIRSEYVTIMYSVGYR